MDVVFTKEVASLAGLIQKGQVLSWMIIFRRRNIDESYYGGMLNELALDGKVYAMPFKKDCTILYYNKDLFDKAGVEYPKDGYDTDGLPGAGSQDDFWRRSRESVWSRPSSYMAEKTFRILQERLMISRSQKKPVANLADYYDIFLKMQNEDKSIMDYGTLKAGNIHYSGVFYNQQVCYGKLWELGLLTTYWSRKLMEPLILTGESVVCQISMEVEMLTV